ncbi:UPF0158 family protein [Proteiniborus sp.]|uniref:UPF0158 family protein n=1 Tax=Proteiniborus sp. TaxID=2079015 RepID=UPI0033287A5E
MDSHVKLDLIVEEMDFQFDETRSFFNKETKEIVSISYEEFSAVEDEEPIEKFPDWQQENIKIAEEILFGDLWIPLPSKFDIHEYSIMERFCLSIKNNNLSDIMYYSIKGNGAFRKFKDNIRKYNIEEDWYEYRDKALRTIAIEWCADNGIEYE